MAAEEEDQPFYSDDEEEYAYSSEDDEVFGGSQPPVLERQESYSVLDTADLRARMDATVARASEMLGLPAVEAMVALRHYRWNENKVSLEWIEDSAGVREAVGLAPAGDDGSALPPPASTAMTCPVCYEAAAAEDAVGMACGHFACEACWREYLTHAVNSGPACVFARCIGHRCPLVVTEDVFRRFLEPEQYNDKYQEYLLRSYVEDNKFVKWCPGPDCRHAVHYAGGGAELVNCRCGMVFCFRCQNPSHRPASCADMEQWEERKQEELADGELWLRENVKPCPQCKRRIWKYTGCNHVTCYRNEGGCGHEWCWMCSAAWSSHGSATGGYYRCNRFEEQGEQGQLEGEMKDAFEARRQRQAQEEERKRYEWHVERYQSHKHSADVAERSTREQLEARAAELQGRLSVLNAAQHAEHLIDGVNTVIECRGALKFTYVTGYFLTDAGPERDLFLYLQESLEKFTDHLQELLERSGALATEEDPMAIVDYLKEVHKFSTATQNYLVKICEGIEGGLTN